MGGIERLRNRLRNVARAGKGDDLDAMLLGGMAVSLGALQGSDPVVRVAISNGSVLEFPMPVIATAHWPQHLTELACLVDAVGSDDAAADCRRVMDAAGWVFGPSAVKTPAWMHPHAEVTYKELSAYGFEWAVPNR